MSHLVLKNFSVHYAGVSVLSDLCLDIRQGEFVAIVGPSGSGKTTLLQALAGFIPASGDLIVPQGIGMVFQHYAVFPWLTVAENIAFGLTTGEADKCTRVQKHLQLIGLEDKQGVYPAQLSGGQIQRVALARALIHDPEVLLMDEPYGALDAYTRDKMQQWLLQVWMQRRTTIVFVTHNLEEAVFLADRVCVLHQQTFTKEYPIPFLRPRPEDIKFTPEFNLLKKEILAAIRG